MASPASLDVQTATIREAELNRLLCAAVVSPGFRHLLVTDPASALVQGYNGEDFHFAEAERASLVETTAYTLRDFIRQLVPEANPAVDAALNTVQESETQYSGDATGREAHTDTVNHITGREDLMLRTNIATPLYIQLYQELLQDIRTGVIPSGTTLPSERQMAALHGVSRLTARKAYEMLIEMEYAEPIQGKGTFVL